MNAVAAPDPHIVFVLIGAAFQRRQHPVHPHQQKVRRPHQLHVQRGVQHIRRRHPLMHKPRVIRPDMLRQMGKERDHIMLRHRLNLINPRHIKGHIPRPPNRRRIRRRDHAERRLRIAGMRLNLKPDAKLRLGRPQGHHLGAGIAGNHGAAFQLHGRAAPG